MYTQKPASSLIRTIMICFTAANLLGTGAALAGPPDNGDPASPDVMGARPIGRSAPQGQKPLVSIVPARRGACAIYDPVGERMIVFGGWNAGGQVFQTWALSLGSGTPAWTQLQTQGFPPQDPVGCAAVYDPVRDRMLVLNGCTSGCDDAGCEPQNAFYELRFSRTGGPSIWDAPEAFGPPPPPRCFHSAVYDPLGDRVIMFGGYGGFDGFNDFDLGDAWELRLSGLPLVPQWLPITSPGAPSARQGHSAVYDPVGQQMFVMGGVPDQTPFMSFWILSLAPGGTPAWSHHIFGNAPEVRHQQTAIFDPTEDRIVLFGGRRDNSPGQACNDLKTSCLWFVRGEPQFPFGWGQYVPGSPAPLPRYGHVAVFDPHPPNNRMIIFGGVRQGSPECNTNAYTNETWSQPLVRNLLGVPWTQLASTGESAKPMIEESFPPGASLTVSPNPISDRAQFSIDVPTAQRVSLVVFDIAGRRVATVTDEWLDAGVHSLEWSGRDTGGQRVSPGVYRCRVRGETFGAAQTLVVMPRR